MAIPLKKVAVIGPECTGKSALSEFLAAHFNTTWVPEYARGYLDNLIRPYEPHDLISIAHGQLRLEDAWSQDANRVVICDTNLYVIKIWSQFKFGTVDPEVLRLINTRQYDLYLLTYIDIPWQNDPQREHPGKRQELYDLYVKELQQQSTPFVEVKGEQRERRATATKAIDEILNP